MSTVSNTIITTLQQRLPGAASVSEEELLVCEQQIRERVRQELETILDEDCDGIDLTPYSVRLTCALQHHMDSNELEQKDLPALVEMRIQELAEGEFSYGRVDGNLMQDVVVAEALGNHLNEAASFFEKCYMLHARSVARRIGGQPALASIENLAADLIVPRKNGSSRISTYQGKTLLKSWLRVTVMSIWYSEHRTASRKKESSLINAAPELSSRPDRESFSECEEMLSDPIIKAVDSIPPADRLLLKMLLLDGAPQNELAKRLKVPAWQITRRKQRASANLLSGIKEFALRAASEESVASCLQVLFFGESKDLGNRIGQILAQNITDTSHGGEIDLK